MKFYLPPMLLTAAYLLTSAILRVDRSMFLQVHFGLEMSIVSSWVAAHLVAVRLFPERKEAGVWLPLVLNGLVVAAVPAILLFGLIQTLITLVELYASA